jgi:sulfatase maturation enzyme AslB (radical SAM superfamily)
MTKNELSPYFCVAPWTHTYVSPQGERRLCCASREDASFQKQYIDSGDKAGKFEPDTLKEHWNSEYMKDIRKRILAGEKISQCEVCNSQLLNLHTYKQYFTETLFPHKVEDIIAKTEPDGHYNDLPVSYDYRISNLCNFKCRMCGDQLSSSWEAENKKNGRLQDQPWLEPATRKNIDKFQKEVLEEELQAAVDERRIEEIYWVGGEPLMWERHWTILEQLVYDGQAKDVTLRYNTNLSRVSYKGIELFDLLPKFKHVNLCASIDGVGKVGEYIRTGLKWEEWLENFKRGLPLINNFGNDAMVFDVTLTTPGLFGLKELFDVVTELNVKSYFKFTFAFDPSVVMSPLCLPKSILEDTVQELLEYIEPRMTDKTHVYKTSLVNLLNRQTFEEQWPDTYKQGIKSGKGHMEYIDSIRNDDLNFRDTLSNDAKIWWDSI